MKKYIGGLALALILVIGSFTLQVGANPVEQTLQLTPPPISGGDVDDKIDTSWKNKTLQTNLLFRSLFLAEADLETVKPDLAKSYSISEDNLVYTIHMKDNVKWSDGVPLTADDVAFSIKANLKAAVTNGIYTSAFKKIKGADAWQEGAADLEGIQVDGTKITITLTAPHATFIPVLAQFDILPKHILQDVDPLQLHNNEYWVKPVSSGMFMVDEMNPGNYYTMVHNPYYEGTKPKITKVVNYFASNIVTTAQANRLDYVFTNSPEQINELDKIAYMEKFPVDILFYRYFIVNMRGVDGNENPAMQDVRVRRAILHAIDRELLATMFPDLATIVNSGILSTSPEYNGKVYEYNPELAKQLLQEAGYDFNRPIRILFYYSDQTSIDAMDAVAYFLGEVGLKVDITQTSTGTIDMFQTRQYDIAYKGLSAFAVDEWYTEYQSGNANFRNIFGGDPLFDELTTKLGVETDAAKRSALLMQLQELEQEHLYKLPLYTIGNVVFVNTERVKLPEGVTFGNPWYRTDIRFEDWEIISN